jgi:formyl-CoA transferase
MGLPELIQDPRFKDNAARMENREALNHDLQEWVGRRSMEEVLDQVIPAGGIVGPVYDAAQIVDDPHYQARDDILEIDDPELGRTRMLGVVPKFSETPGSVDHAGPTLGQHNRLILGSWLGYSEDQVEELAGREIM